MTHGGKRHDAGRPEMAIDERRMMVLIGQGISRREIAERFGVPTYIIRDRVMKLKLSQ